MYFTFSWSIREPYVRVYHELIWETMTGRSENCIPHVHSHTHKGRDQHFFLWSVPRGAEYSSKVWRLRCSRLPRYVHGDSSFLNCMCRGISITDMFLQWSLTFLSCSLSPILQVSSGVRQFNRSQLFQDQNCLFLSKTNGSSSIW